ncbi:MAG: ABC transporter ATP-binding protein, partial [Sphingomonas bacterium]|nr:ABC transporter ATP-binding protein [Sphingomonas bacterium]
TLDLLQEVIADYDGTVLIVSHDRDFLDNTVTVTLGLDGSGKVDIVAGGYEAWMRQRAAAAPQRSPAKAGGSATGLLPQRPGPRPAPGNRKLSFKAQRARAPLPAEIERIEAAIAADEAALHDPDLYARDPAKFAALTETIETKRAQKDAAEHRWLEVAELADALAG